MSTFRQNLDQTQLEHDNLLVELQKFYDEISIDEIEFKDQVEIAEMIPLEPDYDKFVESKAAILTRSDYCDAVIRLYEANIDYLYEKYTLESNHARGIKIITASFLVSGTTLFFSNLSLAIILGALTYYFLSQKQNKKSIESMRDHESYLDIIVDLKSGIKRLEKIRA